MPDDVHGERRLAHTGAGGKHDQIGFLQAVRHLIEQREARFHAAVGVGVGLNRFKFIDHGLNGGAVLQPRQIAVVLFFGNVVNEFFGIRDRLAFLFALPRIFDDRLRRADKRTVYRVALDDLQILLVVCGGRRAVGKLGNMADPARFLQRAVVFEAVGQRNDVDHLMSAVYLFHGKQNFAVRLLIKIVLVERFEKIGLHLGVDEHAAEQRRLRV